MRTFLTVITGIILILALAVGSLFFVSQDTLVQLIQSGVRGFAGLQLELKEPVIDLRQGYVSAEELHLRHPGETGPPLISVLGLSATTDFSDLLSGNLVDTRGEAGALIIYVSAKDSTEDPSPAAWLQHLTWLPDTLTIGTVHLVNNAAEELFIFPLKGFNGQRLGGQTFQATADADWDGEPLHATVNLHAVRDMLIYTGIDIQARLEAPLSNSSGEIDGEVRASGSDFSYDFRIRADYEHISDFMQAIETRWQLEGALGLEARMQGDGDGFRLSDAQFELDNLPEYRFTANGELTYRGDGEGDIAIVATGDVAHVERLMDWLDLDLSGLGRADAEITLSGALSAPDIPRFVLHTQEEAGLALDIEGSIYQDPERGGTNDDQVLIRASAPNLAALQRWTGDLGLEPGPWRAAGRLRRAEGKLHLDQIEAEIGKADEVLLTATGVIDDLGPIGKQGIKGLSGIALDLVADIPDSAALGRLIEVKLPAYQALRGTVSLGGDWPELTLDTGRLTIDSSDLQSVVSDISARLTPGDKPLLKDLRGQLQLALSDTSALSLFVEREVISLGAVNLTADLVQRDRAVGLQRIDAGISGDDVTLQLRGSVGDVVELDDIALRGHFAGIGVHELLLTYLEGFDYQKSLGTLQGKFRLQGSPRQLDVTELEVRTVNSPILAASLAGNITKIGSAPAADLSGSYAVKDSALLEQLTGLRLKPVKGKFQADSRPGHVKLKADATAGSSTLLGDADLAFTDGDVSAAELRLSSPSLVLEDLGLQVEDSDAEQYVPADQLEPLADIDLRERLLLRSPSYPTDIRIEFDKVSGENTAFSGMSIHVTGENNRYTLRDLTISYGEAAAEVRGIIDLNPDPIGISLAGRGIRIPTFELTRDLGFDAQVAGTLSFRGGLSTRGEKREDMLGNLEGSLALALEDAVIEGAAYDVLATDFLAWFYSGALLEKSTRVDCTMARFDLAGGRARSDSLYIETQQMVATGTAKFNLLEQTMDVEITPKSKSRTVQIPSKVGLKGSFDKPVPTISPIAKAADLSTEVMLLVPNLALKLFGELDPKKKSVTPCLARAERL